MSEGYILAVDQSTQGTKGLLFDAAGRPVARYDLLHRQLVDENGWVEHDPMQLLENTLKVCRGVIDRARIKVSQIVAMGLTNQRETILVWDRDTGRPLYNAIVWQCARANSICGELSNSAAEIKAKTGLNLSPYFSAPKLSWLMRNVPEVRSCAERGALCCGTVDSWLIYNLTLERAFKTDFSNASRTQLFNIRTLKWDAELCGLFQTPLTALPEVCMSDSVFGHTTLGGLLSNPIPICGVLGDSHAALFGQNCRRQGDIKATYGTGSSVMMQLGQSPAESGGGLVTSLAWGLGGTVEYVLEGNLNYTGAVMSWLKNDLGLIGSETEGEALAKSANPGDRTYFVPAFTGLGAPYWDSGATGLFTGLTRTSRRAEIVRACLDCIAYQITDLLQLMEHDSGLPIRELRVDGGPTANEYLMQFQSDLAAVNLSVPNIQELSGTGAAYAAGISAGLYDPISVHGSTERRIYSPVMSDEKRDLLYSGWKQAVRQALSHE